MILPQSEKFNKFSDFLLSYTKNKYKIVQYALPLARIFTINPHYS